MYDPPHQVPAEYLAFIGSIAVSGAMLEERLHGLFALLASETPPTPSGGRQINVVVSELLAGDGLNQHIDRLRLLAARTITHDGQRFTGAINRVVSDEFAPSLSGLVSRCKAAQVVRNEMVHAQWSVDRDGRVLRLVRRVGKLRSESKVTRLDELEAAARTVDDAVRAASNFHYDLLTGKLHPDWGVMPGLEG